MLARMRLDPAFEFSERRLDFANFCEWHFDLLGCSPRVIMLPTDRPTDMRPTSRPDHGVPTALYK
jgi:hypothetical protein